MNQKLDVKPNIYQALGVLAIALGTVGNVNTPAIAVPTQDSLKLAQVGVRSRINAPTPLNLRPQTHTPLPDSSYRHHHRSYHRHHGDYGYYGKYGEYKHRDRRYNPHKRRRSYPGTVIIINPSSSYSNYRDSNSYIRVID